MKKSNPKFPKNVKPKNTFANKRNQLLMNDNHDLPDGWERKKLGEVLTVLESGKRPKGGVQHIKKGIPSLGAEHLNSLGDFKFEKIKYVPTEFAGKMNKGVISQNDILIVKDGATTGKTSFVGNNFPFKFAVINEHLFLCRINENINPKYVYYYLFSQTGKNEILKDFRGAAQGGISSNFANTVILPIPSHSIQNRIVEKIEELFSELDSGIEELRNVLKQLKVYRQSVLSAAFSGKLTNKNLKKGELPKGWEVCKVNNIGEIITGSTPSKSNKSYYAKDYPFYKPTDLNCGINTFYSEDGLSKKGIKKARFIPEMTILVTCIGATIGKTGLARKAGACNQQINAIIPNNNFIPKFIYYFCISNKFQEEIIKNASSTTLPILNKRKFSELEYLIIPITEQLKVVDEIEKRLSVYDKIEEIIETVLVQSESIRQSILKKAFEGELI